MSRLGGAGLSSGQDAQLLISLPRQGDWSLAGLNWHRDISVAKLSQGAGVQAFILLDDLAPRGGATLALAGSHKLKDSARARQELDRLIDGGAAHGIASDGAELAILEMTGRAGDVYLMDMRLMHKPSINASRAVRMMATVRYV